MGTLLIQISVVLAYIALGLIGGAAHYAKKRYIDDTTDQNFIQYLAEHKQSTFNATLAIISAEYTLSITDTADFLTLQEMITAITTGYMSDSFLNRTKGEGQQAQA